MEPLTVALLVAAGFLLYTQYGGKGKGGSNAPNSNNVGPNGAGGTGNPGKSPSGGDIAGAAIGLAGQIAGLFGGSKGQGSSGGSHTDTSSGGGSSLTGNTSGETPSTGDPNYGGIFNLGGTDTSSDQSGNDTAYGPEDDPNKGASADDTEDNG